MEITIFTILFYAILNVACSFFWKEELSKVLSLVPKPKYYYLISVAWPFVLSIIGVINLYSKRMRRPIENGKHEPIPEFTKEEEAEFSALSFNHNPFSDEF